MKLEREDDAGEYVQYRVIGPNVKFTCNELCFVVGEDDYQDEVKTIAECFNQISHAVNTDGAKYHSTYDSIVVNKNVIVFAIENTCSDKSVYCTIEFNKEDSLSLARLLKAAADSEAERAGVN